MFMTLRGGIFFIGCGGVVLVGDDAARGGPGEVLEGVESTVSFDKWEKALVEFSEWRSNKQVLKFGSAHWRHSHTQLLDSMHS